MASLEQTKSCRWRAPFHLRMVLASIARGQKHRSFQARALLEPHSLSSKSRPAPVCGQMVLWSRFLRDPALSAHHLLFPTKHMAAENLSPIHCSPLPSPNTLVFQPVPICCYFLLLVHFSSSILLQPCLTAWSNIYACRTYRNNDDMHLLGHFLSLSSCGADSNWMLDGWGGRKYHFGCTNPQLHLSGQSPLTS